MDLLDKDWVVFDRGGIYNSLQAYMECIRAVRNHLTAMTLYLVHMAVLRGYKLILGSIV